MKVFVAGEAIDQEDEFSYTIPGELVHLPSALCECPDCGCDRAMEGFVSHRGTTSFVVRDLQLDAGAYAGLLFDTLAAAGWVEADSPADRTWVARWAAAHLEMAARLPVEHPLRLERAGMVAVRAPG